MKKADDDIPSYVRNDILFGDEIRKWVKKEINCQYEIGRLVHYYIREHGNEYGKRVYLHIAGLADRSERSIRNYHAYYLIDTDPNYANLQNVKRSARYQLARLLPRAGVKQKVAIDAKTLIPQVREYARKQRMTVDGLGKLVTNVLHTGTFNGKAHKAEGKGKHSDKSLVYSVKQEHALEEAVSILRLLCRSEVKYADGMGMERRRTTVADVTTQLLACVKKMTAEDDADRMTAIVDQVVNDANEIRSIMEDRKKSRKQVA